MVDFIKENSSAVFVIIATIVSSGLTYLFSGKQQKADINIQRRKEAYWDTLSQLDSLRQNKDLVFDEKFIESIQQSNLKIQLYGSKSTIKCFKNIYEYITDIHKTFLNKDKELRKSNHLDDIEEVEYEGTIYECPLCTEADLHRYEDELEKIKLQNSCDPGKICQLMDSLNCIMRKDLNVKN